MTISDKKQIHFKIKDSEKPQYISDFKKEGSSSPPQDKIKNGKLKKLLQKKKFDKF
jgi:hypothetical protein